MRAAALPGLPVRALIGVDHGFAGECPCHGLLPFGRFARFVRLAAARRPPPAGFHVSSKQAPIIASTFSRGWRGRRAIRQGAFTGTG